MLELGFGLVCVATTVLVWGLRLEGRVNTSEQRFEDLKELIEAKFDGLDEKQKVIHENADNRLARIERALNGHLRKD